MALRRQAAPIARWIPVTLTGAALLAAASCAWADPRVTWPSLENHDAQRGGLFAVWGLDQRQVLGALRSVEWANRERDIEDLKRRVWDDPTDLASADLLGLACRRKGRFVEAVAELRKVLLLDPAFEQARLDLADLFAELGCCALALQELTEGVRVQPRSVQLLAALAAALSDSGGHARAAEALDALVRLTPDDARAQLALARELLLARSLDAAQSAARKAVSLKPDGVDALLLLARVYRTSGQWSLMQQHLEAVEKAHPESDAARQRALLHLSQREFREAGEEFLRAARLPQGGAQSLAGAAAAALGQGQLDRVMEHSRQLRVEGQTGMAARMLANVWLARGDGTALDAVWAASGESRGLRETYQEILAATQENAEARRELALRLALAEVFREAQWFAQATEAIEAARGLAPDSIALAEMLGESLACQGRRDDELALWEQLAKKHADKAHVVATFARHCMARGQAARAEEVSREFIRRYHDDPENRLVAAEVAMSNGDYATVATECRLAQQAAPLDPKPFDLLLDALVRSGEFAGAATAIRSHEGSVPTYRPGPYERAILAAAEDAALAGKAPAEALRHVERGIRMSPMSPRLRVLAGVLAERQGDLEAAVAHLLVAQWLQWEHPSVHLLVARVAARAGQTPVAVEAYRAMLSLRADALEFQLELADSLSQGGRHAEAVAHLRSLKPAAAAQRRAVETRLADEALDQGDASRALEVARGILAEDPKDAIARRVLLLALRQLGDIEGAIKAIEGIEKPARADQTDAELGALYLFQERYKDAAERFAAAGAGNANPPQSDTLVMQAIASFALGVREKAESTLESAMGARGARPPVPDDLTLACLLIGSETRGRALLAEAEKASPTRARWLREAAVRLGANKDAAATALAAFSAAAHGWHHRAAELFRAALKGAPGEPLLLHETAKASLDAGLLDHAVALARELVRTVPQVGGAQLLLARALDKQGQTDAAMTAYAAAFPLLDKQAVAERLLVANRLAQAGRVDDAIQAYRDALESDQGGTAAAVPLARLFALHKPERLDEAERLAAGAAKATPDDALARDTLGWIRFLARKHDQAWPELRAALALEPTNPTYLFHYGMAEFVRGRREPARRALRMALALDPKLPDGGTARTTLKALEEGAGPKRPGPQAQ